MESASLTKSGPSDIPGRSVDRSQRTCMVRLGLCCSFLEQPIKFRTAQVTGSLKLPRSEFLTKMGILIEKNADALLQSLDFCNQKSLGSFRVTSYFFPLMSHKELTYQIEELPNKDLVLDKLMICREFAKTNGIRMGFHPDQFTLLNTFNVPGLENSVRDLEVQALAAEFLGADTVNIHGGSSKPSKKEALERLRVNIQLLSDRARSRLTLENDDKTFTPQDLYSLCLEEGIPLVYDVHHHRCNPDIWNVEEASARAAETWGDREPLFHISSPREGWKANNRRPHHDYIDSSDWPLEWNFRKYTVEVEAKAKELAVLALQKYLDGSYASNKCERIDCEL
jgi:UV DNA damage endonuclease